MAISYPLSLPTTIGIENITLRAANAVAISESPFTYRQQIVSHPGQRWEASIRIPPVRKDLADAWVAFILSLKGPVGTFLLNDPDKVDPSGSASVTAGTPLVNGGGQTGDELNVNGLPPNINGYLLAGDYIQVGSGSTATLHKVLQDVDTNFSGEAILDIWPNLRFSPADASSVVVSNAKGRFRLKSNVNSWEIDNSSAYGINFEAVEVVP